MENYISIGPWGMFPLLEANFAKKKIAFEHKWWDREINLRPDRIISWQKFPRFETL